MSIALHCSGATGGTCTLTFKLTKLTVLSMTFSGINDCQNAFIMPHQPDTKLTRPQKEKIIEL